MDCLQKYKIEKGGSVGRLPGKGFSFRTSKRGEIGVKEKLHLFCSTSALQIQYNIGFAARYERFVNEM